MERRVTPSALLLLWAASCVAAPPPGSPPFLVGAGKADVTGPAADVVFMGYANPLQRGAGVHFRQFARAFVLEEAGGKGAASRLAFVSLDACMATGAVKAAVLDRLRAAHGEAAFTEERLVVSGIHTHAGPGGYLTHVLYDIPSLGFVRASFDALVDGIVEALEAALASLRPGSAYLAEGELGGASRNRSPTAYEANPASERALYARDVDTKMTLLRLDGSDGTPVGAVAWFAVHCTSMNNTNRLISGDNKGHASALMERWGGPGFVAAFAQSNEGDVSPNTLGAFCQDTGEPCERNTSTCGGRNELCVARGPGWPDHFESTRIVGERQYERAVELWERATEPVSGTLDARHTWVDMSDVKVAASASLGTRVGRTCKPAVGFSFAAGTTDGPGAFDFTQGDVKGNAFWNAVRSLIKAPSAEQRACHAPKPILLDLGEIEKPYPWAPSTVPIQVVRIGQLALAAVPAEFSTMAGRRLREALLPLLVPALGESGRVVVAGLSNEYADYVTTREEYAVQRYEGASTIYGPATLDAYIQEFARLARALAAGAPVEPGTPPPDLLPRQLSFLPPVVVDEVPPGARFGGVLRDADAGPHAAGSAVVEATFHSASPRNDLRRGGTFAAVERWTGGAWEVVADDAAWELRFEWGRPFALATTSHATVRWAVPADTPQGRYRLRHDGAYKTLLRRGATQFTGVSRAFAVA